MWALNSPKIYKLVKGKFVEPFTCLQHEGELITDRQHIDQLLQRAWNPIFAKYVVPETKADEYRAAFYPLSSPFESAQFPKPSLDDLRCILTKKLKNNTDPMNLSVCQIVFFWHYWMFLTVAKEKDNFHPPFITHTPLLYQRASLVLHLAFVLLLSYPFHIEYTLAYVAKPFLNGRILGFTLLSSLSVKSAALLALIATSLSI